MGMVGVMQRPWVKIKSSLSASLNLRRLLASERRRHGLGENRHLVQEVGQAEESTALSLRWNLKLKLDEGLLERVCGKRSEL